MKKNQEEFLDQVIDLWNQELKGLCSTCLVRKKFSSDKKFMKKFTEAREVLVTLDLWDIVFQEIKLLFDDPWWIENRRLKQGFDWLFQRRSMGEGEINWIYYYELAITKQQDADRRKELHIKHFGTE